MKLKTKKGFIGDVFTLSTQLFLIFLIFGICIYLIITFNSAAQSMTQIPTEAKTEGQAFADQYPTLIGWLFTGTFIGMVLYTIITAYLIDIISRVWFVIGLIVNIIIGLYSGILKLIYDEFAATSLFGASLNYIPAAVWYFNNIILVNAIIGFLVLIALYFKK